jgi:Flp pilus assembly protein CpaB
MRLPSVRRKLPLSAAILYGIAAALALTSFLLVRSEIERARRVQAMAGPMAAVVVAATDLPTGAAIGPADVRTIELPRIYVPPGALAAPEDAIGLSITGALRAGEVLTTTRLAVSRFGTSITPGNVVVTIGFASVPEGLSVADRIDAYATYAGARPYTTLVGEDLHVLSIALGEAGFDGPAPTVITLDVQPAVARQLLQASAAAVLGAAARGPQVPMSAPTPTPSYTPPP